jgi:hypothetical protein
MAKRKPNVVTEAIKGARSEGAAYMRRCRARNAALPRIRPVLMALKRAGSLNDLQEWGLAINTSYYEGKDATVEMFLKDEQKDSQILRDLVRITGQPAHKSKESGGSSLTGTLVHDRVEYRIHGYVPASCRLVEEDVVIPAQPERIEKRTKIICTPEEANHA